MQSQRVQGKVLIVERRRSKRTAFRKSRRTRERVHALGVDMDLVRPEEVMHHVEASVEAGESFCVANYNAHGIYLGRTNPDFAKFCEMADLIEVDSTPIILFTRLLGLHARPFHRCTYLDWREHFWSLAQRKGWRIFYLGGAPGVAEKAADRLRQEYPGIEYCQRVTAISTLRSARRTMRRWSPRSLPSSRMILFVGMGMPRQEAWLLHHTAILTALRDFLGWRCL